MTTFTSTLPDELFEQLSEIAKRLSVPKNKIIEKSLTLYLQQLSKAEYRKTYQKMSGDTDVFSLAEEGMLEYYQQLNKED